MNREVPSISVVGNCQSGALAAALKATCPHAEIQPWHLGAWPVGDPEEIAQVLQAYDHTILLLSPAQIAELPAIEAFAKEAPSIIRFPPFVFSGFHPDCIAMVVPSTGKNLSSPFRDLHSQIIACAFVLGLPENRVEKLFNRFVFEGLGYLHSFAACRELLVAQYAECGLMISDHMERWARESGAFMWIPIHPKKIVFRYFAEQILDRLKVAPLREMPLAHMHDTMESDIQFPVFSEIAQISRVKEELPLRQSATHTPVGRSREYALSDQVHAFYQHYRGIGSSVIEESLPSGALRSLEQMLHQ